MGNGLGTQTPEDVELQNLTNELYNGATTEERKQEIIARLEYLVRQPARTAPPPVQKKLVGVKPLGINDEPSCPVCMVDHYGKDGLIDRKQYVKTNCGKIDEEGKIVRKVGKVGHIFCKPCLIKIKSEGNGLCPICKATMPECKF